MKRKTMTSLFQALLWIGQLLFYCGFTDGGTGKSFYVNRQVFSEAKIDETEAMILKSASTVCTNYGIEIAFSRNTMTALGIGPNQFMLEDESCLASANDTHYILYTRLADCNSSLTRHNDGKVQVTNSVIVKPPSQLPSNLARYRSSLLVADASETMRRIQIGVTCNYRLSDNSDSHTPSPSPTNDRPQQKVGLSDLPETSLGTHSDNAMVSANSVDIEMFRTDSFTSAYSPETSGEITKGTSLYIKVSITSEKLSKDGNIFLESCYLTDVSNGDPDQYHYLIESGCPNSDRDVQLKNDDAPYYSDRRFLFRAQRPFKNRLMMLVCNLVPCFNSQCTSQAEYCRKGQRGAPSISQDSMFKAVYGHLFTVRRRDYVPPTQPTPTTPASIKMAVTAAVRPVVPARPIRLPNIMPLAGGCPPQRPIPRSVCQCPTTRVGAEETTSKEPPDSGQVTVSIGVTIAVAIGMFVLGATLVGLLWLVYVKTDPNRGLKTVAISEDGISSSQESANGATQRLMGHSRDLTAHSLQS